MNQKLTIELTPDQLTALVAAAVQREVAHQMPASCTIRGMIRAEVSHITRGVVGEVIREALPGIITGWLNAREGWVATLAARAARRAAT